MNLTDFESISIILQSASLVLIAIGLYHLVLTRKVHSQNHDLTRRITTQEILRENNKHELSKKLSVHFDWINSKDSIALKKILVVLEEDENKEVQGALHALINIYEGYARGIFQGVYDEELIKVARKTVMIRMNFQFQSYINYRREYWRNDKVWDQFEKLVKKWNAQDQEPLKGRSRTGKV